MTTLREWISRLKYFGNRSQFEDDLDAEVRFHLESRAGELHASGLSRAEGISVDSMQTCGPL